MIRGALARAAPSLEQPRVASPQSGVCRAVFLAMSERLMAEAEKKDHPVLESRCTSGQAVRYGAPIAALKLILR